MKFIIILVTAFISTILSSMSGGGTGIINIPVFLLLGIPLPTTVAINQISGAFWVLPAARNYLKGRKINWIFIIVFCSIGLIGAYYGVLTAISFNQRKLETIIGSIIILLAVYTYFNKGLGMKDREENYSRLRKLLAYPFALLLGFYESVFGSGNGIFFSIVTFYTRGFDFIEALGSYYIVVFFWVIFAALLYTQKGFFNWYYTIPSILGGVAGGYVGSKYAKHKGNKFIKLIFVIIGSILGLKLIIGV